MLAFLGGLSAAAGMVMVESVAISTMLLNHIFMPVIVRFTPQTWFPSLLINLKRFGIFLVIFLGYFYYRIVGESFMLVNMGMISFSAAAQFLPAMLGGLYWRRGNKDRGNHRHPARLPDLVLHAADSIFHPLGMDLRPTCSRTGRSASRCSNRPNSSA